MYSDLVYCPSMNKETPGHVTADMESESARRRLEIRERSKAAVEYLKSEIFMADAVPDKYQELIKGISKEDAGSWGDALVATGHDFTQDIRRSLRMGKFDNPFEDSQKSDKPDFAEILKESVKDNSVCDLGGGQGYACPELERPVQRSGAKRYINVDLAWKEDYYREPQETEIEAFYLNSDMLSFVSRVKDAGMGAYVMSGLEPVSIKGVNYLHAVVDEVYRSLCIGGVLLHERTVYDLMPYLQEKYINTGKMEVIYEKYGALGFALLKKLE